ncbi:unnamed protein product, partial [Vitis vinifera]|uniref:Uncharacterized protein n=1 Tax=Vitis vinifera TaxID=29760 RepID=D7TYJ4_VITVI
MAIFSRSLSTANPFKIGTKASW